MFKSVFPPPLIHRAVIFVRHGAVAGAVSPLEVADVGVAVLQAERPFSVPFALGEVAFVDAAVGENSSASAVEAPFAPVALVDGDARLINQYPFPLILERIPQPLPDIVMPCVVRIKRPLLTGAHYVLFVGVVGEVGEGHADVEGGGGCGGF